MEVGTSAMSYSILVVDDEDAVRSILRQKLEVCGYDICEAADGAEAVRALETLPFDLVITDIIMPQMDGLETISFIRRKQPYVKIIAISVPSNDLFLESAEGLGANRVFAKPLNLAEIAETVADLLPPEPAE